MRGTMYRKCVLTVPLTTVHTDYPLNLKKGSGIMRGIKSPRVEVYVEAIRQQRWDRPREEELDQTKLLWG